jgi:hypothetical protein
MPLFQGSCICFGSWRGTSFQAPLDDLLVNLSFPTLWSRPLRALAALVSLLRLFSLWHVAPLSSSYA